MQPIKRNGSDLNPFQMFYIPRLIVFPLPFSHYCYIIFLYLCNSYPMFMKCNKTEIHTHTNTRWVKRATERSMLSAISFSLKSTVGGSMAPFNVILPRHITDTHKCFYSHVIHNFYCIFSLSAISISLRSVNMYFYFRNKYPFLISSTNSDSLSLFIRFCISCGNGQFIFLILVSDGIVIVRSSCCSRCE